MGGSGRPPNPPGARGTPAKPGRPSVTHDAWVSESLTTTLAEGRVALCQLVEGQAEAGHEGREEVAHLREVGALDALAQHLLRLGELAVPGAGLLQTLDVGAELVRGLDELEVGGLARPRREQRPKVGPQLRGDRAQELLARHALDGVIRGLDVRVEVLHGPRQIAGEDLAGIVVEPEGRRAFGAEVATVEPVA